MEFLVYFVMAHGTMVITALLGAIVLCVFTLLLASFHNPKDAIALEVGTVERLEGVMRKMLSEQDWPKGGGAGGSEQVNLLLDQVKVLEKDIQDKQKQLDTLQTSNPDAPDIGPLQQKIKELEDKLNEYSVIEEDIADLSRYRQENEELKDKLSKMGTGAEGAAPAPAAAAAPSDSVEVPPENEPSSMPWDDFERIVKEKKVVSAKENATKTE